MSEREAWAPERIWLQREAGEGGSHTWCENSIDDCEQVEYVRVDVAGRPPAGATAKSDDLKAMSGPLLELDVLLAAFHKGIWDDYERGHDFDEAGVPECKAIQRHVRAMLAASKSVSLVIEMTDERVRRAFYLANCRAWYDLKPSAARGVAREIILAASAAPVEERETVDERAVDGPCTDSLCHFAWIGPHGHNVPRAATAPTISEAAISIVRKVRDTFRRDMEQGFVTKDKQFAVEMLSQALAEIERIDRAAAKGGSDEQ